MDSLAPEVGPSYVQHPAARLSGEQLAGLSNAIVALHRRYYGRGATKAKTYQVHDDLVIVELRDVYLTVERTLIERGQEDAVRHTRTTFQQAMVSEFIAAAEAVVGRRVTCYVTDLMTTIDALLEIFYLEPVAEVDARLEREVREDDGVIERPAGGIPAAEQ